MRRVPEHGTVLAVVDRQKVNKVLRRQFGAWAMVFVLAVLPWVLSLNLISYSSRIFMACLALFQTISSGGAMFRQYHETAMETDSELIYFRTRRFMLSSFELRNIKEVQIRRSGSG